MVYLISIILLYRLYPQKYTVHFLIFLPVIDTLHNILPGKQIGHEYLKILSFWFIYYIFFKTYKQYFPQQKKNNILFTIHSVVILLLLLSLTSTTDFFYSLPFLLNFINVLIAFKVYYWLFYVHYSEISKPFFKNCFYALLLWVINIVICSIFHYGRFSDSYTGSASIYFGHTNFFSLFPMVYLLMLTPYYFFNLKKRVLSILLFIISFIIFLLVAKRTYIYITAISLSISLGYYYLKKRSLLLIMATFLLLIGTYSLIGEKYYNRFASARERSMQNSYFEEGRFLEISTYGYEVLQKKKLWNTLFGKEVFNSQGKFFHQSNYFWLRNDKERIFHSDFAMLLYGTGLVGISAYIIFLFGIFFHYLFKLKKAKNPENAKKLFNGIFIGIFIAFLFNLLSDGILGFSNRLIPFMLLGALSGLNVSKNSISNKLRPT